jgi:hypothetical protein
VDSGAAGIVGCGAVARKSRETGCGTLFAILCPIGWIPARRLE